MRLAIDNCSHKSAVRGFNNAAFNAKALAVNVSDLEKKFEYPPRPKVELP